MSEDAKRITAAVLSVLKKGGDNLAIYQAVHGALAATDDNTVLDSYADENQRLSDRILELEAALAAPPDGTQGALALYLNEVQPVDGRAQINISLDEMNVLRHLVATPALEDSYPVPRYVEPANACDDRSTIEAKSQAATPAVGGEALNKAVVRLREYASVLDLDVFADDNEPNVHKDIELVCTAALAQPASPLPGRDASELVREKPEQGVAAPLLAEAWKRYPQIGGTHRQAFIEGATWAAAAPVTGREIIPVPLWAVEDLLKYLRKMKSGQTSIYPLGLENLLHALMGALSPTAPVPVTDGAEDK